MEEKGGGITAAALSVKSNVMEGSVTGALILHSLVLAKCSVYNH